MLWYWLVLFEKVSKQEYYKPASFCFISASALSWDTLMTMTGAKFELASGTLMGLFIKKEITGGILYISHRYSLRTVFM